MLNGIHHICRIDDFEFTPECAIFDLLDIPLYHGWIVDPQVCIFRPYITVSIDCCWTSLIYGFVCHCSIIACLVILYPFNIVAPLFYGLLRLPSFFAVFKKFILFFWGGGGVFEG